jgi:fructokinase
MTKQILCFGNVGLDMVPVKSPGNRTRSYEALLGGAITNTAVILSLLNDRVIMLSKTGKDLLSGKIIELIREKGVITDNIARSPEVKASLAFAEIDSKGDSSYTFYQTCGPALSFRPGELSYSILDNISVLHTGSKFSYDDHTHTSVLDLVRKAYGKKVLVTFDPNWRQGRVRDEGTARKRIRRLLPHVGLLKLSVKDALGITEKRTARAALNDILNDLNGSLVVTDGPSGSFYWNGKKEVFQKAFKVRVADTIGAGDAFSAGLIHRYVMYGKDRFAVEKKENLCYASALSAMVCAGKGAQGILKDHSQVVRFLRTHCG